jgi:hypothetical protein
MEAMTTTKLFDRSLEQLFPTERRPKAEQEKKDKAVVRSFLLPGGTYTPRRHASPVTVCRLSECIHIDADDRARMAANAAAAARHQPPE